MQFLRGLSALMLVRSLFKDHFISDMGNLKNNYIHYNPEKAANVGLSPCLIKLNLSDDWSLFLHYLILLHWFYGVKNNSSVILCPHFHCCNLDNASFIGEGPGHWYLKGTLLHNTFSIWRILVPIKSQGAAMGVITHQQSINSICFGLFTTSIGIPLKISTKSYYVFYISHYPPNR